MFSVIIFYRDNEFKAMKNLPDEVYLIQPSQLIKTIEDITVNNPNANYTNKKEIASVLKLAHTKGKDPIIVNTHLEFVKTYKDKNRTPH